MATNGIKMALEHRLEPEAFLSQRVDRVSGVRPAAESAAEPDRHRDFAEPGAELALAPLVDKIAYGLAKGLVVAMKELENHIASETRNVGDTVGRRLDTLHTSFQELTEAVSEQRSMSLAVQEKCEQLAVATTALQESDARQAAELAGLRSDSKEFSASVSGSFDALGKELNDQKEDTARRLYTLDAGLQEKLAATNAAVRESDSRNAAELAAFRTETKEFSASICERINDLCKELGVHQEDIAAVKGSLCDFSSRVDAVVERLDRQGDALRSMYSSYAQRETELEQLVDGLARLRAYPAPPPMNRL